MLLLTPTRTPPQRWPFENLSLGSAPRPRIEGVVPVTPQATDPPLQTLPEELPRVHSSKLNTGLPKSKEKR